MVNVVGVIFVIIGLAGFFNNPLLGIFAVNSVHNILFLISGIFALSFGNASEMAARNFALIFGIVYALLAIIGFSMPGREILGMAMNGADNWLHLILAGILLPVGLARHPNPAVRSV